MDDKQTLIEIGKRLRLHRTMRGYSQSDVGEVIGVTFQQVQKYERGVNNIAITALNKLLHVWGISWDEFMQGLEPEAEQAQPDGLPVPERRFMEHFANLSVSQRAAVQGVVAAMQEKAA